MKPLYSLLIVFGLFGTAGSTLAAVRNYEKIIERNFDISKNGTTSISNKYGKVTLQTWDRNEIFIRVIIEADASSEKEAKEAFDRVTINFLSSPDKVSAKTELESKHTSWWSWDFSQVDLTINYEVFLPITNNLELEHKYGNFSLNEIEGEVNINLGYGKGVIKKLNGFGNINLAYGNISIEEANDLTVSMKYSDLKVVSMRDLEIESKYSKIEIDQASSITTYSKYDHFNIGALNNLKNSGKFDHFEIKDIKNLDILSQYSDIEINRIREVADMDLKYGGGNFGLAPNFKSVTINGEHANFKISILEDAYFDLILKGKYASIKIPEIMELQKHIESSTEQIIEGIFSEGTQKDSKGVVKINLQYGGVKIEN